MRPYGIMFHHFHDDRHPAGQGSISARQFAELIEHLGRDRILPAGEWLARAVEGTLTSGELCLTFDDTLRCQYDIALPVLRDYDITAFWFVASSVMQGRLERLELYRKFRATAFEHIDEFYEAFGQATHDSPYAAEVRQQLEHFEPSGYLADFAFYTTGDRQFRYVRDELLGPQPYREIMDHMIASRGLELEQLARDLWMGDACVRQLDAAGHLIGLHSHTHPTRLAELDAAAQRQEYQANYDHLTRLLPKPPACMSHPCNSYNDDTLAILRDLGIVLGFRANLADDTNSLLELPRQDHATILAEMLA